MKNQLTLIILISFYLSSLAQTQFESSDVIFKSYYRSNGDLKNCNDCEIDATIKPLNNNISKGYYFNNERKGRLLLEINSFKGGPKRWKRYELHTKAESIRLSKGIRLSKFKNKLVYDENEFKPLALEFEVSKNGNFTIDIEFALVHRDYLSSITKNHLNSRLRFEFSVSGIRDCRQFISQNDINILCNEISSICGNEASARLHELDDWYWERYGSKEDCKKYVEEAKKCGNYNWKYIVKAEELLNEKQENDIANQKAKEKAKREAQKIKEMKSAWKDAQNTNNIPAYERFIKKYPKSDYVKIAKEKIVELTPIEVWSEKTPDEDCKIFTIDNVISLEIEDISLDDGAEIGITENIGKYKKQVKICRKEGGDFKILFIDDKWKKIDSTTWNEQMELGFSNKKNALRFDFEGGTKPYSIYWKKDGTGEVLYEKHSIASNTFSISADTLAKRVNLFFEGKEVEEDTIFINAYATSSLSQKTFLFQNAKMPIIIEKEEERDPILYWLIFGISMIVLCVVLLIYFLRKGKH